MNCVICGTRDPAEGWTTCAPCTDRIDDDAKPCAICGHGIAGRPSVHRISGRIAYVHSPCRDEMRAAEKIAAEAERRRERDERRLAILRGEIL